MTPAEPVTRRSLRRAEYASTTAPAVPRKAVVPLGPDPRPTTRRAIREAERSGRTGRHACPAPARRTLHRATSSTNALVRPAWRQWSPMLGAVPTLGLIAAVAAAAVGVGYVYTDTAVRTERAAAAAIAAEDAHQRRVDAAAETRLTGIATAMAAERRTVALEVALEALDAADAAVVGATNVVAPEAITPLVEAAAELAALVEQADSPVAVIGTGPAATDPLEGIVAADAVLVSTSADGEAEPAVDDEATPPTSAPTADDRTTTPRPATGGSTLVPDPEEPTGTAVDPLEALDVATSDRLREIAEQVTTLSVELRAAAQAAEAARIAAEQAAAEAARAAEAAGAAAAAELARKISAADSSPNGAIPLEMLCGVSFDSDTLLRCDAAAALDQLNLAFRDHFGRDLPVGSSYRDFNGQVVAKQTRGELAATPGTSNHGRGLAVDLDGFGGVGQFDQPYFLWMQEHAGEYGWLHPSCMEPGGSGPPEPWHWEFDTE